MSIDDTVRAVDEALDKAKSIDDILQDAVSNFGDSLGDCLDVIGNDMRDMFEDVFKDAGKNLSSEFKDAAKEIKDALNDSVDLSDVKKQIRELKEELDRLRRAGPGGGGSGGGGGGSGGGGAPPADNRDWRQRMNDAVGGKMRRTSASFITNLMNDMVKFSFQNIDDHALGAQVSSQFRQIQRSRPDERFDNMVTGQIRTLKETLSADPQELMRVYSSAIQAGFTSDEVRGKDEFGNNLATRMLKTDKFLKLESGTTGQMAEQMRGFDDTVTADNITDKMLEMKAAAESSGVSFNKFSNAAMSIGASLRPLGLDISHVTGMLENLAAQYRESGMSDQRAFEMASKNVGAMGQAFSNMDMGALAALAKQFGSDALKETFKGKDQYETGMQLKMAAKGIGMFGKDPEKRAEAMSSIFESAVKRAQQIAPDSYERQVGIIADITGGDIGVADAILKTVEGGELTPKKIEELTRMMDESLITDSDNIKTTAKAAASIEGLLASMSKFVVGGILGIMVGIDELVALNPFGDGKGVLGMSRGERAQLALNLDSFTGGAKGFTDSLLNFGNFMKDTTEKAKQERDVKKDSALSLERAADKLNKAGNSMQKGAEAESKKPPAAKRASDGAAKVN